MFLSDSLPSEIRFRQAYTLSFYLSVMGGSLQFRTTLFIHTASSIPRDSSVLLSSFFTRSMVFAHIPRAQLLFALLSETFLAIRQNSLNVTACMIARSSCRGYFIHSLSTLYYYNAPSLTTRLTGDYRDRTYTGKCSPALLDTHKTKATNFLRLIAFGLDNTYNYFSIFASVSSRIACRNVVRYSEKLTRSSA